MIGQINNRKENDSKKIFTALILVLTLMVCTTSATYAYFALSASNNAVTGTAATVELNLGVTRVTPTDTKFNSSSKVMVPQLDAGLGTAMNTTNSCVDANGNVVCYVYKITIENGSTAAVRLRGAVYFTIPTGSQFTNLYWSQASAANTLGSNTTFKFTTSSTANSTSANAANSTLIGDLLLQPTDGTAGSGTDFQQYFVVIWIRETNTTQNSTDTGTWRMNVSFQDKVNSKGVTSTITS